MNTPFARTWGRDLTALLKMRINPREVGLYARPPRIWMHRQGARFLGRSGPWAPLVKSLALPSRPVFQGGAWDRATRPFAGSSAYRRIEDLYRHRLDYRQSATYRTAVEQLARGVPFTHKTFLASTVGEIERYFEEHFMDLVLSMERYGYVDTGSHDRALVMITREGKIIKGMKGRHRFAAAQITGAPSVPVRISHIHKEFLRERGIAGIRESRLEKLAAALEEVERRYQ